MQGYKNSDIEWIGSMPSDWKLDKIKYIANLYGRIGWQGLTSEEYIDEGPFLVTGVDFCKGRIDWNSCVHISEKRWEQADKIQIKNEDLLITKDGTVGKVAIVSDLNGKASLNSGVLLIDLNDKNSKKYLYWVLCSDVFWTWFNYKNSGNSTILHLYQKDFSEFIYTLPVLEEQKLIGDFLDKKCSEIDSVIKKIEKQVSLLQDYKKSLIIETVTKGLNRNVSMKYSGVEWIGKIPKHWTINRLRYLVDFKTGGTPSKKFGIDIEGDYPWITASDIKSYYIQSFQQYISEEAVSLCNYKIFPENTILIVCIASIGKIGISKCKSYSNQQITALYNTSCNERFLLYSIIQQIDKIRLDASSSVVPIINTSYLKDIYIGMPQERKEQIEIADFLDKKCSEIDSVISKKERQLNLIRKHRKSLIYEYVTGKKRVGGVDNDN